MRELLSNIEFAKPLFFWAGLALPILWFRFRDQSFAVLMSRTFILALLILTLADPQAVSRQPKDAKDAGERIFAFDLSRSIPASMRQWMAATAQKFELTRRDRVFVFASQTKETDDWKEWLGGTSPQQGEIGPQKTNLESLFSTLLALPAKPRSVYLFTDGWETQGSMEHLLPSINAGDLKVFPILPRQRPSIPNVTITKLVAPTHGKSGEPINLKVVLENQNDREVEGTLSLTRNGQAFRTEAVKLKPGSQIFTYEVSLPETERTSYSASFKSSRAELDTYEPDNHAVTWVTVQSKAKALLLSGQSGGGRYLEEILKRQGFEVHSHSPESAPAPTGYGVVVFNNAEREKFPSGYLAAVERYVSNGGGFLMLGGEASFAPNAYRRTPIENLLPVEPKEPRREEKNRAVVLVIDKSGSMREENKMLYAQEAAKAVARQLKDNDLLAIVGFDVSPFVVVPMETVGRLRPTVDSQISRLKPGGQTYFYPALVEAKRQIERANATRKHVILISDGETRGTQGELIDLINVMKSEMKITVSAVAIGDDADIRIMKRISQYGGGLFHHTLDASTLPQIVLQQLQDNPKEEPRADKEFTVLRERGSEVLGDFAPRSYPNLRGYMDTELKRNAHLDLAISRAEGKAPLMASWHFGRGKSLVWTTDLDGRWSRNWIQWQDLQRFWGKVFSWLAPEQEPIPSHEARVSVSEQQPILDLFVYEDASLDSRFHFSITGRIAKTEGNLKKLAAGHFQAPLPISTPGDYRVEITEERKNHAISYPSIGYTLPSYSFDAEIPRPEFNNSLLAKLAQGTGGEINPPLSSGTATRSEITTSYKPIRQPLIMAAFLLFLFEIVLRKFVFAEPN